MAAPDKSARYDRQLRLWAENGQRALENTRIALIGGNAVGSETLKNLVLPGIGSYTIIDELEVSEADTGVNFFVDVDSVGQSRAKCVCEYLQELNSDVDGKYIAESVTSLLDNDQGQFIRDFDMVLVADLDTTALLRLSSILWAARIPLVIVSAMGFMGYLRIALPEHTVVESHPESISDLRLDVPWPELSKLAETIELEKMNDNEHTHVPFILLLLHYMQVWKDQHDGRAPSTFAEKTKFKALIRSGMRNDDEDNFEEAINNVWRACSTTNINADVLNLLEDPAARNLTSETTKFWFLTRAVSDFVKATGLLPLCGDVPDMKSDTTTYINLQQIYRAKAKADIASVKKYLQTHLSNHHRSIDQIPDQEIAVFCKHAAFLKVLRYRSLKQEFESPRLKLLHDAVTDPDSPIHYYLAKRDANVHKHNHGTYPGGTSFDMSATAQPTTLLKQIIETNDIKDGTGVVEATHEAVQELARAGSGVLHNVASFMGGITAQEIIKIITKQYIPINNTVIFDGVKSVTAVYEL